MLIALAIFAHLAIGSLLAGFIDPLDEIVFAIIVLMWPLLPFWVLGAFLRDWRKTK